MFSTSRVVLVVLAAALLALQYRLWVSPQGLRKVFRLHEEVQAQRDENARLVRRNELLAAEVKDLREGVEAIEERARHDLGMIREQETFYRSVPAHPVSQPAQQR